MANIDPDWSGNIRDITCVQHPESAYQVKEEKSTLQGFYGRSSGDGHHDDSAAEYTGRNSLRQCTRPKPSCKYRHE